MGCLKLSYYENLSPLKVVHRNFVVEENSCAGEYRYGFNGHEKDDEIKGSGNHLAFGDYGYDTRIGRRWNIEPLFKKFPQYTPYIFCLNNPIILRDEDGKDPLGAFFDALTSFTATAALSYVENRLGWQEKNPREMDHSEAFRNINWKAAGVEGGKSYLVSFFVTGLGSIKTLQKLSTSKAGKVTTEFVANVLSNVIGNAMNAYNEGEFSSDDKSFSIEKFKEKMPGLLIDAFAEASATISKHKMSKSASKKLDNALGNFNVIYSKMKNARNSEIASNYVKKVNKAATKLFKAAGIKSLDVGATESLEYGTVKTVKKATE